MGDNQLITKDILELTPDYLEGFVVPSSYKKFPWEVVPALGTAFDSFAAAFQNVFNGAGGSGIYRVDVPNGGKMFSAKSGTGFIGSTATAEGTVGGGQARLNPIQVDVGQLCSAVTLATIQLQLSDIKEQEKAILDYMQIKDEATMLGHIDFLIETLDSYRLNWDNEAFRSSRRNKIVSILADAKGEVKQYKKMADVVTGRKRLFHSNKRVENQLQDLLQTFTDYKIAISLYAFSAYMDVMMHETYAEEYLTKIANEIKGYIMDYRLKYTECYNQLEAYAKSTLEGYVAKGLAKAQYAVGKAAEKVPLINKTPAELKLKEGGEFLEGIDKDRIDAVMKSFIQCKLSGENVFANQIEQINMLHNHPIVMLFDKDNFYIADGLKSEIA